MADFTHNSSQNQSWGDSDNDSGIVRRTVDLTGTRAYMCGLDHNLLF